MKKKRTLKPYFALFAPAIIARKVIQHEKQHEWQNVVCFVKNVALLHILSNLAKLTQCSADATGEKTQTSTETLP